MIPVTYRDAGVDIEKGAKFAAGIYELMQRTFGERVVSNPGGFGALFSLDYDERLFRHNYAHPVLISATDGVGTKLAVAFATGRHNTIGIDLVAMCVNDILVLGAEPLFFLDYLVTGALEPDVHRQVVAGIATGCKQAACALLGGETAEHPGFYKPGEYDLAGFAVGVAEQRRLITGRKIEPGDTVVGLPSSGLHSNGYSLARRLFFEEAGMACGDSLSRFGIERTLGDELLVPTRIYVRSVRSVLRRYKVKQVIGGIVHVTGGGLLENVPRVLPEGSGVELDSSRWQCPPVFDAIRQIGSVPAGEMYRTFNMGIGMVLIVSSYYVESVMRQLRRAGEEPVVIGSVVAGAKQVTIS
ncbi:MAG: phosphoribosylformylglycinamidine cyclo-ligase [Planctomycetota bacterium]|jgi:phosphoribosylformylglycinamidine cyclo-ligase